MFDHPSIDCTTIWVKQSFLATPVLFSQPASQPLSWLVSRLLSQATIGQAGGIGRQSERASEQVRVGVQRQSVRLPFRCRAPAVSPDTAAVSSR